MTTVSVWVLFLYASTFYNGGPAVIDSIATKEECVRLGENIAKESSPARVRSICLEVKKVVRQ